MLDINLSHYNEMLRYEPLMDELRALAVIIVGREQADLFNIIKYYSRNFAEDIKANGRISDECLNRFKSAMFTITSRLNITPEMIGIAHEDQLYKGSGFWEMRWNLGQFPDIAEQVKDAGISHIICAGISGRYIVYSNMGNRLCNHMGNTLLIIWLTCTVCLST